MARSRKKPAGTDEVPGTEAQSEGGSMSFTLTKAHRQSIKALVINSIRHKKEKEALSDDAKGIATAIGCKPAEVNQMVQMIIQEQEKGGVIEARERSLEFARTILDDDMTVGVAAGVVAGVVAGAGEAESED